MHKSIITLFLCVFLGLSSVHAAYVAMSQFDINGDGNEEIVRAEGMGDTTAIRIYEKIDNSYFFKPVEVINVQGNLVQVPEVADFTGDAILDLFFATGSDLGIIYYDTVEEEYRREYEVNADIASAYIGSSQVHQDTIKQAQAESDILLKMQTEPIIAEESQKEDSVPLQTTPAIQTI